MSESWPRLYAIADEETARRRGLALLDAVRALLDGGATLIQMRTKTGTTGEGIALAAACVRLAQPYGARIIVNDRPDVALLAGTAGVHLGQDDLAVDDARLVLGPDAIVGLSTHEDAQVRAAGAAPATYLAIGPVFASQTKPGAHPAVGLAGVARARRLTGRPLVAIGGVTLETASEVIAAGADSVAVIAALLEAPDVAARTRAFLERLG